MGKPVFDDLFAASGRRNRQSYIRFCLACLAVMLAGTGIVAVILDESAKRRFDMSNGSVLVLIFLFLVFLVLAVSSCMVGAQRCRDFGWTGWAILLTAVPALGFVFAISLLFIPGNQGDNLYGSDPLI